MTKQGAAYEFGEIVKTPHNELGEVIGIWKDGARWRYRLKYLHHWTDSWWKEDQLTRATINQEQQRIEEGDRQ
ncbi:hypothetical protein IQ268_08775 [Oculatella sp. LEGE 06141]|uniref:hypothetical protein n=1 Tax=Oculatella sp. LEGE 06141 TaxID=1828648 RepID=UPI0018800DE6|nr:hypothetical protein [Oculatella sp. LEGE 06141]MBE9178652.1 hypothetical protein [Oculatella sp. LEGE 06141]